MSTDIYTTKTYHGKPCKKAGHTERYVSTGNCIACTRANKNKAYAENTEYREYCKAYDKKRYAKNPEKRCAYNKKHYAENTARVKARCLKWARENPKLTTHYSNMRRAKILQQTPPWADLEKIKQIYLTCPKGYEVDHIHPLSKGGLHVHYNLQHLTIHENRTKSSKL